ncbi:MAG: methyltransferase domain-containing protein [Rhodobacterales bacterium]|nr:methyltransferase domain-containing protein [Rhodobacterales bacterium]
MWMDVVDLRDFYASDLGQMARRLIRRRIRAAWPDTHGLSVLGLGYAVPFLHPFRAESTRVIAAMPAHQGVLHWPLENGGLTFLVDETELPLPDLSMDRVLLVHSLECTEQVRIMMREVWRVLAPSGRLLVVVPNRTGLWARLERTPFGHGRPYTQGQLRTILRDCLFTPLETDRALFMPPARTRLMRSWSIAVENLGRRWLPALSGVVMVEATKQIYEPTGAVAPAKERPSMFPVTQPNRRHPMPSKRSAPARPHRPGVS